MRVVDLDRSGPVQLDQPAQRALDFLGSLAAERLQHAALVLARQQDQPGHRPLAFRRDAHQRDAPVAVVVDALHIALVRHAVELARHGRLLAEHDLCKAPGAQGAAVRQGGQHAPLGDRQATLAHHRVELRGDQQARLGQQRGQVVVDEEVERARVCGGFGSCHGALMGIIDERTSRRYLGRHPGNCLSVSSPLTHHNAYV